MVQNHAVLPEGADKFFEERPAESLDADPEQAFRIRNQSAMFTDQTVGQPSCFYEPYSRFTLANGGYEVTADLTVLPRIEVMM